MSKIVVAKLHRLGKNGDKFDKNMKVKPPMRTNAKVDDEFIANFNENWHVSGQLYEVDEEKTKARDAKVKGAPKNNDVDKKIREELKAQADKLGIEYPKNIKSEKLSELISEKENG